ncbi:hypothetical protein BDZ94DRAFT_1314051 [Collybia nuda]|uniref:BTB domain-containing protein n=1 Tax=Collybia nuda TaxID=64659 RepID=A0A9P5XVR6_9AGAR|nr:hypothetical protein BDZ94DRAFT_1314051 [Collybia nuda]
MDSAIPNGNSDLPKRDDLHYLEPMTFQVEDSLFKVPQYHFVRESEVFRDMLLLPQPLEGEREGSSDSKPLFLEGVSKIDFQRLLKVMYPLVIGTPPGHSKDEWISVLKLSAMWRLIGIRKFAIDQLTRMELDPIEKTMLAKEFKIPQWLQSAYQELATRQAMLTDEEARKIGYPTAIRVWHVREEYWRRSKSGYGFDVGNLEGVFAEELKEARAVEDCLFNVPKYHFVKSSDNFMKEYDLEGTGGQVPLTLDGISKVDFQRFLKVIYPLDFMPSMDKPAEEWVSVLKLSTRWHFDVLRKLALSQLTSVVMNPVERVVLAKQFNMWQWLRSGYESLVTRPEMISLEEAERIGYSTVHALYRTREERSRGSTCSCCFPRLDLEGIFAEEKWAMEAAEAAYNGAELESLEPPSRMGIVESGGGGGGKKKKKGRK